MYFGDGKHDHFPAEKLIEKATENKMFSIAFSTVKINSKRPCFSTRFQKTFGGQKSYRKHHVFTHVFHHVFREENIAVGEVSSVVVNTFRSR